MIGKAQLLNFIVAGLCLLLLLVNVSIAVSPEELEKIENAVPAKATVKPRQPRKLLVFDLCKGYAHSSIPYWNKALEIMGRKTGAFETVISNDMAMFKPESLNQFDAVCFNNTTKLEFEEPLRRSLMNFINGGKGVVGIHAATDNFYNWPQAAEMMGGQFCGHPWMAEGTWAIKIDEPGHPLMASFEGQDFKISDEIYRTKPPLYSRAKQHVLMSLDMTDEATANAEGVEPTDKDIGISWVKTVGKGRLFYCSLGHNHHIIWNPKILRHYLDGIQFALGDFPVDLKYAGDSGLSESRWKVHDMNRPRPPVILPGRQTGQPPSHAIVLFDGKNLSEWVSTKDGGPAKWKIENGYMQVVPETGGIRTKKSFGSCHLHIEWAAPAKVEGTGQERGNSGVFLMNTYEVQILNSYNNDTYPDGQAAALYGRKPPSVNASLPPGQWQSYDIIFHQPIFKDGKVIRKATFTVLHNGVLVHDHYVLTGGTGWKGPHAVSEYDEHPDKLPLMLQEHGNPLRFRNIWLVELPD